MTREGILKKAYRYRKLNAFNPNYRKYYEDYITNFEEVSPRTFRQKVLGETNKILPFNSGEVKQAAKSFIDIYETEVIGKVRDIARNRSE